MIIVFEIVVEKHDENAFLIDELRDALRRDSLPVREDNETLAWLDSRIERQALPAGAIPLYMKEGDLTISIDGTEFGKHDVMEFLSSWKKSNFVK